MPSAGTLATIASLVTAAGMTMLFFRISRELAVREQAIKKKKKPVNWIALADSLLIGATLTAIVVVLVPMILFSESKVGGGRIPTAGCAALLAAYAGYPLAILAHYRLAFAWGREGKPQQRGEPAERAIVAISMFLAVVLFVISLAITE